MDILTGRLVEGRLPVEPHFTRANLDLLKNEYQCFSKDNVLVDKPKKAVFLACVMEKSDAAESTTIPITEPTTAYALLLLILQRTLRHILRRGKCDENH